MTFRQALEDLTTLAAACLDNAPGSIRAVGDDELLTFQRQLAAATRHVESAAAVVAAEVQHRSRRELGYDGLSQKRGARTADALIQTITGSTSATARRLVRVGTLITETTAHHADPSIPLEHPWLTAVARAAAAGRISAEAVDAIRVGLGKPTDSDGSGSDRSVTIEALTRAAESLAVEAETMPVDRLAILARQTRDDLDTAGVELREQQRREARSLRLFPQPDGMTRMTGLLDPESAAVLTSAIDAATSPRRGGPRFVGADDAATAERILADPRTTEQLALDTLIELIDVAIRTDSTTTTPARRRADVRVIVTQADLDRRALDTRHSNLGAAHFEGQTAPVSIATAERHACDSGLQPILFDDDGAALNLGRTQRLHTTRQRTAIAVRDGGCLMPDCDRPASWCEVHHITEYSRGGNTDLADGILLCRHHHMLMHNNGWHIHRTRTTYWLVPPPDIDPRQLPIRLQSKNPAIRRMIAANRRAEDRAPEVSHARELLASHA